MNSLSRFFLIGVLFLLFGGCSGSSSSSANADPARDVASANGQLAESSRPQVPTNKQIKKLVYGDLFACALLKSSAVECWARDYTAQTMTVPKDLPATIDIAMMHYGRDQDVICALSVNSWRCWGPDNPSGQVEDENRDLGIPSLPPFNQAFSDGDYLSFLKSKPEAVHLSNAKQLFVIGNQGGGCNSDGCPDYAPVDVFSYFLCVNDDNGSHCWNGYLDTYAVPGMVDQRHVFVSNPMNIGSLKSAVQSIVCQNSSNGVHNGLGLDQNCYIADQSGNAFHVTLDDINHPEHTKVSQIYSNEKIYDFYDYNHGAYDYRMGNNTPTPCRANDQGIICPAIETGTDTLVLASTSDFHIRKIDWAGDFTFATPQLDACANSLEGGVKCSAAVDDFSKYLWSAQIPFSLPNLQLLSYSADNREDMGCFITNYGPICRLPNENGPLPTPQDLESPILTSSCVVGSISVGFDGAGDAIGLFSDPSAGVSIKKCTSSGAADTSFGQNGVKAISGDLGELNAPSIFSLGGSYYVVAARGNAISTEKLEVVKLNANGSLDQSFGDSGIFIGDVYDNPPVIEAQHATLDSAGNLVVTGRATYRSTGDFSPFTATISKAGKLLSVVVKQ